MKFVMTVRNSKTGNVWPETYDERDVKTLEAAEEWAKKCIEFYNSTLRPGGNPRELISVSINGESVGHDWEKDATKMSAHNSQSGSYDGFYCKLCGITGKRFGIGGTVVIDSKFRKKVFQTCTAQTKKAVAELK